MVKNKLFILLFLILCGQSIFARRAGGSSVSEKPERQVDIDFKNAVYKKDFEAAKKAFKNGANVNAQDSSGSTLLIRKVQDKNQDAIAFLLTNKADVNVRCGRNLMSALMWAADSCNKDIIQLLLKYKADKSATDAYGNTAKSTAMRNQCPKEVIDLL